MLLLLCSVITWNIYSIDLMSNHYYINPINVPVVGVQVAQRKRAVVQLCYIPSFTRITTESVLGTFFEAIRKCNTKTRVFGKNLRILMVCTTKFHQSINQKLMLLGALGELGQLQKMVSLLMHFLNVGR